MISNYLRSYGQFFCAMLLRVNHSISERLVHNHVFVWELRKLGKTKDYTMTFSEGRSNTHKPLTF